MTEELLAQQKGAYSLFVILSIGLFIIVYWFINIYLVKRGEK